jgi:hypothetical protein
MKQFILMASLASALVLPVLAAPTAAHASCEGRKMTGTVLGGVGGALIGNSISRGGGGALIGGLGGAVLGHEIAKSGCGHSYRREASYGRRYRDAADEPPHAVRYVYYDQYGDPVSEGPVPAPAPTYTRAAYGPPAAPACRTEMQSFYDSRGALEQGPVQTCAR